LYLVKWRVKWRDEDTKNVEENEQTGNQKEQRDNGTENSAGVGENVRGANRTNKSIEMKSEGNKDNQ